MQYKQTTKIIIDKRKLDVLIRLGCPDTQILELIKTGNFTRTGDNLIDETLECLIDVRDFDNWGGKRKGAGRKQKNQLENQLEIQDENHLDNQDAIQVVDKDIDIDIEENNSIKEKGLREKPLKEEETKIDMMFSEFWSKYIPVKCFDGKYTDKGGRKPAYEAFKRALKKDSFENIMSGLERYLENKKKQNSMSANASTFLNQERWKDESEEDEDEKLTGEEWLNKYVYGKGNDNE